MNNLLSRYNNGYMKQIVHLMPMIMQPAIMLRSSNWRFKRSKPKPSALTLSASLWPSSPCWPPPWPSTSSARSASSARRTVYWFA